MASGKRGSAKDNKSQKSDRPRGMRQGLATYGDAGFSLFLRKAFIKGAGYTDDALHRPVVGIANTGSSYNPCHGNAPQLFQVPVKSQAQAGKLVHRPAMARRRASPSGVISGVPAVRGGR